MSFATIPLKSGPTGWPRHRYRVFWREPSGRQRCVCRIPRPCRSTACVDLTWGCWPGIEARAVVLANPRAWWPAVLLRLAYLAVTNTFTALRLLPMSECQHDVAAQQLSEPFGSRSGWRKFAVGYGWVLGWSRARRGWTMPVSVPAGRR